MIVVVDELIVGINKSPIYQSTSLVVDGKQWDAITVTEDDGNGPPPSPPSFPWPLFMIAGVVIVGIRTKKLIDEERRS